MKGWERVALLTAADVAGAVFGLWMAPPDATLVQWTLMAAGGSCAARVALGLSLATGLILWCAARGVRAEGPGR